MDEENDNAKTAEETQSEEKEEQSEEDEQKLFRMMRKSP